MGANRITAEFVYTLDSQEPIRNGFVEYDEDGTILNVGDSIIHSYYAIKKRNKIKYE